MSTYIFLNLLFLCGVLYQGIGGTVSEKGIGESPNLLVRQKRVISRVPGEDVRESIKNVPYIVFIRERRSENYCSGTILTKDIVITVMKCLQLGNEAYRIFSATSRTEYTRRSTTHNILEKRSLSSIHPYRNGDGISLLNVHPPFIFGAATQSINFFEGHLHPGTLVTVIGWGCDENGNFQTQHPTHLRSIKVPIISFQECANIYHRVFPINEADICTLDPTEQRQCAVKDAGAPLVIMENHVSDLVGLHLWNGGVIGRANPDVFINLQDFRYKSWIVENIRSMEANIHVHSLNLNIHG